MRKKLPVDVQGFEYLISNGYLYIDKTPYIYQLLTGDSRHYFVHRPRRFGKSLLTSALQAVFQGKRELFESLYLASTP